LALIYRYKLLKEQQQIEAEQLAQEEREANEELKRRQVELEKPTEDTSLVSGLPGDVNLWHDMKLCSVSFGARKQYGTQSWKLKCTKIVHDGVQWLAFINTVLNIWVSQKARNFLAS
jgi:hypothetical protein